MKRMSFIQKSIITDIKWMPSEENVKEWCKDHSLRELILWIPISNRELLVSDGDPEKSAEILWGYLKAGKISAGFLFDLPDEVEFSAGEPDETIFAILKREFHMPVEQFVRNECPINHGLWV